MNKFCTQCGAPLTVGAKFCSACGEKIVQTSEYCNDASDRLEAVGDETVQRADRQKKVRNGKKKETPVVLIAFLVALVILVAAFIIPKGPQGEFRKMIAMLKKAEQNEGDIPLKEAIDLSVDTILELSELPANEFSSDSYNTIQALASRFREIDASTERIEDLCKRLDTFVEIVVDRSSELSDGATFNVQDLHSEFSAYAEALEDIGEELEDLLGIKMESYDLHSTVDIPYHEVTKRYLYTQSIIEEHLELAAEAQTLGYENASITEAITWDETLLKVSLSRGDLSSYMDWILKWEELKGLVYD